MKETFILVHGAFADSHAFDAVRPLLEAQGHRVITPDLPGHGADTTPVGAVTLDRYVAAVRTLVEAEARPVVLVGHSMAGLVVAQVAEQVPARVKRLVFVAAYLPRAGDSLEALAKDDGDSLVGRNMQFAPDWSTVTIARDALPQALAADLPEAVQRFIVEHHRPEPLAPFRGVVSLSDAAFGSVPRAYLKTTRDRAVTPMLQSQMLQRWPGTPTASLDTGHLPFLAQPGAFADALLSFLR